MATDPERQAFRIFFNKLLFSAESQWQRGVLRACRAKLWATWKLHLEADDAKES